MLTSLIARILRKKLGNDVAALFPNGNTIGDMSCAPIAIRFWNYRAIRSAFLFGYVGFMESYFRGDIDIIGSAPDPLSELIRRSYNGPSMTKNPFLLLRQWILERRNDNSSFARAKKNAEAHYALPAEFFRLFLGDTYGYTEGYFRSGNETQDEAQREKFDLIAKKLALKPGLRVNEVGSGWGFASCHIAKRYGVSVVNYGLVEEQNRVMREMVAREGLGGRVVVVKKDYRDLADEPETYDRHFSIGVLEHAGFRCHESWIRAIATSLKDGGIGVISTMGRGKRQFTDYLITKYIFPGGYIPSLPEIIALLFKYDLHLVHKEDLRLHYGRSCELWLRDFRANWDKIRAIEPKRFTEEFRRKWEVYLAGSTEAFRHAKQNLSVYHLVFTKGRVNAR